MPLDFARSDEPRRPGRPAKRVEPKRGLAYRDVSAAARRWAPAVVIACAVVAFRLPVLLNAGAVNSDGAVVGLQAMHMLRGEWSWILWGAPYQAPGDSAVAAAMFQLLGRRPLVLVLGPVLEQILIAWMILATLRRVFDPWPAVWLTLAVVVTPTALNCYLFNVQRQLCFTAFIASIWVVDGAQNAKRPGVRLALGAWIGMFTTYLDLFALQWAAPLAVFAMVCALPAEASWRSRPMWGRIAAAAAGLLAGWISVRVLRALCPAAPGALTISLDRLSRNFHLLWTQALPWALGTKIFAPRRNLYPDLVDVPPWFDVVRCFGALVVAAAVSAAAGLFWVRRIPWRLRRLGLLAVATIGCCLGGFLVSGMPADMWSTRYLAPIVLVMPFALAPAARLLGARRSVWLGAPYLVAAAVGGWIGYGATYVDGPWPIRSARGTAREEQQVAELLREHKIAYGAAQYWLAYRLTFLFGENPIVVPLAAGEDRYPPYRAGFEAARDVAYIFHPSEPRARPQDLEASLRRAREPYERYTVADFTVFIEHRR